MGPRWSSSSGNQGRQGVFPRPYLSNSGFPGSSNHFPRGHAPAGGGMKFIYVENPIWWNTYLGSDLRQPHQQKQLSFPDFQGWRLGCLPSSASLLPASVLHPLGILGGGEVWLQTFFLSNGLFIQLVSELSSPSLKGWKEVKSFCMLVFLISRGSPNIVWGTALGLGKQDWLRRHSSCLHVYCQLHFLLNILESIFSSGFCCCLFHNLIPPPKKICYNNPSLPPAFLTSKLSYIVARVRFLKCVFDPPPFLFSGFNGSSIPRRQSSNTVACLG